MADALGGSALDDAHGEIPILRALIADAEAADTTANRKNTNLTSRYTFTQGALRGLSVGGSMRRAAMRFSTAARNGAG